MKIDFEKFQVEVGQRGGPPDAARNEPLALFRGERGPRHPPPRAAGERLADAGQPQHPRPDQFIRRLRKLFEPNPAQPRHFLTIRDAGYRFVAAGEEEGAGSKDEGSRMKEEG